MLCDVETISDAGAFQREVLEADRPVVVDFFADWCPTCRVFEPTYANLAQRFCDRVKFVRVDCERAVDLEKRYEVCTIPTVLLFRGGQEVRRWVNVSDINEYSGPLADAAG